MPPRQKPAIDYSKVSIEFLDDYLEKFYEDNTVSKVEAAKTVLYLCFSNQNMEYLLQHETAFGTISRTLRDDYKKSLEMTLYLLNVFQAYSNFTDFHDYLIQNQIGDTTMKIIEHEIKRY